MLEIFAHICLPPEGSAEALRSAGLVLVMPTADITCLSLGLRLHLSLVYLPSVLVNPLERDRSVALDRCGALTELFVKIFFKMSLSGIPGSGFGIFF